MEEALKGVGLRSGKEAWIGVDRTRLQMPSDGLPLVSCSGGRVAGVAS